MTDQYRLTEPPDTTGPEARPTANGTDTLLWIVLVLALAVNGAFSLIGLDPLAVPFGVVALVSGITLIVRHLKRRK